MERIKLKVLGVSCSISQAGSYALILADEENMNRIPILIGIPEAQSIVIQLEKIGNQRPLAHDLICVLMERTGIVLKEVFIYQLEGGIFYTDMLYEHKGKAVNIEARTSDAIAVALRCNAPIFTTPEIAEKAGLQEQPEVRAKNYTADYVGEKSSYTHFTNAVLNEMLDEAILKEEYEKAAEIKTEIDAREYRK